MGGVDISNYTLRVLKELVKSQHANTCFFTIVIGASYPYTSSLSEFIATSNLQVTVLSDVNNMAELMSESDLCIGAAGSTSWERCCLGLPTIAIAVANNQEEIAQELHKSSSAIRSNLESLVTNFDRFFKISGQDLVKKLSKNASLVCDGLGAHRVLEQLER